MAFHHKGKILAVIVKALSTEDTQVVHASWETGNVCCFGPGLRCTLGQTWLSEIRRTPHWCPVQIWSLSFLVGVESNELGGRLPAAVPETCEVSRLCGQWKFWPRWAAFMTMHQLSLWIVQMLIKRMHCIAVCAVYVVYSVEHNVSSLHCSCKHLRL